jgi:hypothetical protein
MTDVVMGRTVLWVIGIYSGEGGQFSTIRSGEKCRRVNLQVLKNSGLWRSMCYRGEEAEASKSPKWIYTVDLGRRARPLDWAEVGPELLDQAKGGSYSVV